MRTTHLRRIYLLGAVVSVIALTGCTSSDDAATKDAAPAPGANAVSATPPPGAPARSSAIGAAPGPGSAGGAAAGSGGTAGLVK